MSDIKKGALVVYKAKAAIVTDINDKIEILFFKTTKRVRDKDVVFLHPGPIDTVDNIKTEVPQNLATLDETIELLEGETATLEELSDYLFNEYTPQSAWSTWMLLDDGLYFEGDINTIKVRPLADIKHDEVERAEKQKKIQERYLLLERIKANKIIESDYPQLVEIEQVACGEREKSQLLKVLGLFQTKEEAHKLLMWLGYWQPEYNPWPRRLGANVNNPDFELPQPVAEPDSFVRHDLTHLKSWAIDDEGNQDPDDAISIDGNKIWVHISDVSSLVAPDTELDIDARSRGANLYLPEKTVHMLPTDITEQLGLGLHETSPALTISYTVADDGQLNDIDVCFSTVKVDRISYGQADQELDTTFKDFATLTQRYKQKRLDNDAAQLDFPEVNMSVVDGKVVVSPLSKGGSRDIVMECMVAAGEAIATFCLDNEIPVAYASQPTPDEIRDPQTLSEHYDYRMLFKRSTQSTSPSSHFGLGLDHYSRVTSPMRRYLDMVLHQQIRAFLTQQPLISTEAMQERIALADEASFVMRKAERFSRQHWSLIYFKQNPDWTGEAVVMGKNDYKMTVSIAELGYELKMNVKEGVELDDVIKLSSPKIDIINLDVKFKVTFA